MSFKIITSLYFLLICSAKYQGKLRFREDNTFTVLQFTDMHFGEKNTEGYSNLLSK